MLGDERGLLASLDDEMRLEYDSTITRDAATTFASRKGNCLGLVIMTAAFAKHLGLKVLYQNILVDEQWSRAQALPESAIIAMYNNNRAAEALAQGQLNDAYWWARAAIVEHPAYNTAYNTLGVIYQHQREYAMAERAFKHALEREPENLIVLRNLAPVLAAAGKQVESAALSKRLASIDPTPPYHFFNLGKSALEQAKYQEARALQRRVPFLAGRVAAAPGRARTRVQTLCQRAQKQHHRRRHAPVFKQNRLPALAQLKPQRTQCTGDTRLDR
jgi:cytochrome c-type biogenesis protein CcmH/NrfG